MKTTKKDFYTFKKEFMRWVEILGLKRYEIRFSHQDVEDSFAMCTTKISDAIAHVELSVEIGNGKHFDPKFAARHEALELLLAPLLINAAYRYVSKEELTESSHAIIRTLENVLR